MSIIFFFVRDYFFFSAGDGCVASAIRGTGIDAAPRSALITCLLGDGMCSGTTDGVTRRLNELALQTWRGDRIAEERFVYDTGSAWQVVE